EKLVQARMDCGVTTSLGEQACIANSSIELLDKNGDVFIPFEGTHLDIADVWVRASCHKILQISQILVEFKEEENGPWKPLNRVPYTCADCRLGKQVAFVTSKRYRGDWGRHHADRNA